MYTTCWGKTIVAQTLVSARYSLGRIGGMQASAGSTKRYTCLCAARAANPGCKLAVVLH